jgi:hypothetical protein
MPLPRQSRAWIWMGRAVAGLGVAALAGYLFASGLDKADKLGSAIGALVALVALVAPYLLPTQERPEPLDRAGCRGIDLGHARGVQINQSGGNTQNNYNALPSIDDDLRTLGGANPQTAYKLFSSRPPDRQLALIAEYTGAIELIKAVFTDQSAGRCADILRALRVDRAAHLLDGLAPEQQAKIMVEMARKLADKDSLDGARTRVKKWAEVPSMPPGCWRGSRR